MGTSLLPSLCAARGAGSCCWGRCLTRTGLCHEQAPVSGRVTQTLCVSGAANQARLLPWLRRVREAKGRGAPVRPQPQALVPLTHRPRAALRPAGLTPCGTDPGGLPGGSVVTVSREPPPPCPSIPEGGCGCWQWPRAGARPAHPPGPARLTSCSTDPGGAPGWTPRTLPTHRPAPPAPHDHQHSITSTPASAHPHAPPTRRLPSSPQRSCRWPPL